ncbi:MerR family transcriptional regulator [Nocardia tengchongensis]|uniref:MerR family transcriptional regulator n=1 Tax=Nocardia tengchongensis TaxID=2055889 RepID=UPI0036AA3E94
MTVPPGAPDPEAVTEFTVGVVARRLGVPVATLRSWNQRYGLGPQRHRPGRHRHYTEADLAVVTRMVELVRAGAGPASAARAARVLLEPAPPLDDARPVITAAEHMQAARLLGLITVHLAHYGVIVTWNQLCRPAFAEIVANQRLGRGYIDVEHILSWAITTALHRGVPTLTDLPGEPEIVLACTGGEQHVLPLEVLRAALAEHGRPALLLGASVPPEALAQALTRRKHPATVVLWSQSKSTAAGAAIAAVESSRGAVLLAGPGWQHADIVSGRRHLDSLDDAVAALVATDVPAHSRANDGTNRMT